MLLGCLAIVLVTHRNSGDVGAAADLADARQIIQDRAGDAGDPFAPVHRGTFQVDQAVEVPADTHPWVTAVEVGHFSGDGTAALRIVGTPAGTFGAYVELRSGENGLVVELERADATTATLSDRRSGRAYGEVAVERAADAVVVPLLEVFDGARAWEVLVVPSVTATTTTR